MPHQSKAGSETERVERAARAAWEHQVDKLDPDCKEADETWETTNESARTLWRSIAKVMIDAEAGASRSARPSGNNADEWAAWFDEHQGFNPGYLGVQVAEALDVAAQINPRPERVRHLKRGTEYEVLGEAELQRVQHPLGGDLYKPLKEGDQIVVYRGGDGKLWARGAAEFRDGRFETIAAAPAPPIQGGVSSPLGEGEGEHKQRRDEDGFACEYDASFGLNADDYTILWDNGARWLLVKRDGKITIGRSPADGQQCFTTTWDELFSNRSGHLVPASLAAPGSGEGSGGASEPDLVSYLHRQWAWSKETFGPALRTKGIVQHITKELREIEAEPHDLAEWVDVIILAMDGFWRHGGKPEDLLPALQAKQDRNFARTWPDWRTMGEDQAIEHDRSGEAAR